MPNNAEILKAAKEALDKALAQKELNKELIKTLGPAIIDALKPVLNEIAGNSKLSKEEILSAISNLKINIPEISVPKAEIKVEIPEIRVPEPRVTVNVPKIEVPKIPEIKIPPIKVPKPEVTVNIPPFKIPDFPKEMGVSGWIGMMGYDRGFLKDPLPVQLRDAQGNPMNLIENITAVIGGGGGKRDFLTIKGFGQSAFSELTNADGRLRVSVETGGSGLTDAELRASHLDTQQVSGSVDSVYVLGAFGSSVADGVFNADNRIRVSVETGGSGLTDSELRAAHLDVQQVSGSIDSVKVTGFDVSVAASLVDSSGVQYSGSNPLPVSATMTLDQAQDEGEADARTLRVVHAGDVAVSTNAIATSPDVVALQIIDDWDESDRAKVNLITGVAGVAANQGETDGRTMRVIVAGDSITSVAVSGSINSVISVGPTAADAADDGNPPVQFGGIARQANPTAVAANDVVKATFDDLGRQLVRPVQVRDLVLTAYASVTNVTETTLLAATAAEHHDLIYIMGANASDAAVVVNIRAVTGGSVVMTLGIPAGGTAGVSLPVPIPQQATGDGTGNNWTFQNAASDDSTTTIYVTALFSKEI